MLIAHTHAHPHNIRVIIIFPYRRMQGAGFYS